MYLAEQGELTKAPQTIWFFDDVGHTQDAKKEALAFNSKDVFATPKPERLIDSLARIHWRRGRLGALACGNFEGRLWTNAINLSRLLIGHWISC